MPSRKIWERRKVRSLRCLAPFFVSHRNYLCEYDKYIVNPIMTNATPRPPMPKISIVMPEGPLDVVLPVVVIGVGVAVGDGAGVGVEVGATVGVGLGEGVAAALMVRTLSAFCLRVWSAEAT